MIDKFSIVHFKPQLNMQIRLRIKNYVLPLVCDEWFIFHSEALF
jgi:hypothetical protein